MVETKNASIYFEENEPQICEPMPRKGEGRQQWWAQRDHG